ncbi:hypothetical protein E4T56_gene20799 [Termitomyces sp. T112]|nr:hypothetical protein E4T56_gene20799 [Termitomyces sp. T112]
MVFCLNPAKTVLFPRNPTSPDLPRSIRITSHQLSAQAISARNVFECSVTNARGSRPPSKDSPSAAEPPRSAEPDRYIACTHLQFRQPSESSEEEVEICANEDGDAAGKYMEDNIGKVWEPQNIPGPLWTCLDCPP